MNNNRVRKAMVMSAGMGSRLEPLTLAVPKPLIPVANRPVMDILFERLKNVNITDVICNTYYLAEQIINRYKTNSIGINFNYIEEETLSGTAGGLKKCQKFFNEGETFLVLSADGLTNADFEKGIDSHIKSGAIATIGIKQIPPEEVSHFGVVVTDENGFIKEFQEKPSVEEAKSNFINTGIYIFNYEIFKYIPENTFYDFAKNVFPDLLANAKINTFDISEYWTDIGTIAQYKQSTNDVFKGCCEFNHSDFIETDYGSYVKGQTEIPSDTKFVGVSSVGNNCKIGKNVTIIDSIIWDDVVISDGCTIKNSIIASGTEILSDVNDFVVGANQTFFKDDVRV